LAGLTFTRFEKRHAFREQFESMRLLYVAATRAQDRLILSGTTKELDKLGRGSGTWLNWIWQSLEMPAETRTGIVNLANDVQLQLTINHAEEPVIVTENKVATDEASVERLAATAESIPEAFPLLGAIEAEHSRAIHRFSVTQLINYQRCPRQYYFDRVLYAPAPDAIAVWNNAEAPEPPANLTATLKGAVIHRFCETYLSGDDAEDRLRKSYEDILRKRQAELADRLVEIDREAALAELLPLAKNYLSSAVFERVERARAALTVATASQGPRGEAGLWSELAFRLRRPLGILSGAIDKLLVSPAADGKGLEVEVIDFKTNRLTQRLSAVESALSSSLEPRASRPPEIENENRVSVATDKRAGRSRSRQAVEQFAFDFNALAPKSIEVVEASIDERVRNAAADYQLQMQAYALAVRELMPILPEGSTIISTLQFLEPNVEFHLPAEMLSPDTCKGAIDDAMMKIVSSGAPGEFPVHTAAHCRMCNFLGICSAGRDYVRSMRQTGGHVINL
jgi:hypothetical protein